MLRALILLCLLVPGLARAQALETRRLADGRSYLFAAPKGVAHPPVILALHGGGGNPRQFARSSGLVAPALARGYAVAFPAGSGRTRLLTWNAGHCCGYAAAQGIDDLGFLDAVVADLAARDGAGPIFVTGMSNGAMMAAAFAATRPGTVRAGAWVAGTLDLSRYPPKAPVPVLHIHGDADPRIPFDGGAGPKQLSPAVYPPVAEEAAAFAARWPTSAPLRERSGNLIRDIYRDRAGRPVVVTLRVVGGGHTWFGGRWARRQALSATQEVLDFFDAWR
ncbi:alpha/beta hydrolase family esterase [Frigidibacter sp. ROC022]|uniref:alpha/beta hydrolase family esterase n=1 Tax=Frigidibacter sp. ROC022 TaxID=2971796 RepID=UPI00215AEB63|nr:hypothetical protein [Frigidibacter sp. ROC022]MCR8723441.1 hypothetical protein [Frigidibacter sp. ROC022]